MKAIIYNKTKKSLSLETVDIPTPKEDEILIKVHASSMNTGDLVRIKMGLLNKKQAITGSEFSGEIVLTGSAVEHFKTGDDVFGYVNHSAHAEYICMKANGVVSKKPEQLKHNEAAALPNGLLSALFFIRKAELKKGERVLIYGASGSVGVYATQLAKSIGAEVHAVCGKQNETLVQNLGAEEVFDYRNNSLSNLTTRYDLIFDAVGKSSLKELQHLLKGQGRYATVALNISNMLRSVINPLASHKLITGIAKHKAADLTSLNLLLESNNIKPVIDRTYSFTQGVEALEYVKSGRKKGNVVIDLHLN